MPRFRLAVVYAMALLSAAGLVAFGLAVAASQSRSKHDVGQRFADRAAVSGALIEGTIDSSIPSMGHTAGEQFAGHVVSGEALQAFTEENGAAAVAVLSRGGRVLGATGEPRRAGDFAAEPYVQRALSGKFGLSPVRAEGSVPMLEVAVPFSSKSGQRVVVLSYPLNIVTLFFGAPLARIPRVERGYLLVVDQNGRVVVASGGGPAGGEAVEPAVKAALDRGGEGEVEIDGEMHRYVVRDLAGSPWKLVSTAPESLLFAALRGFGRLVPWIMLVLLGLTVATALAFLRRAFLSTARMDSANRELEQRNREVERATRAKSEFLANMSHELRTPLNGIIGFAELLHDGKVGPVSVRQREYLGDVLSSAQHLLELINDVLDISKVEAGRLEFRAEEHDPACVASGVITSLSSLAARKRIEIALEADPRLGSVVLDPGKLRQILYNYLSNALKFTASGGGVTVRLTPEGADSFRLAVEDTGVGIAAEDLDRLFVEFGQLDAGMAKSQPGTGLGLALTKQIVEAQGGSVGVSSELGKGSTFWAVLPRRFEGSDEERGAENGKTLDTEGAGLAKAA